MLKKLYVWWLVVTVILAAIVQYHRTDWWPVFEALYMGGGVAEWLGLALAITASLGLVFASLKSRNGFVFLLCLLSFVIVGEEWHWGLGQDQGGLQRYVTYALDGQWPFMIAVGVAIACVLYGALETLSDFKRLNTRAQFFVYSFVICAVLAVVLDNNLIPVMRMDAIEETLEVGAVLALNLCSYGIIRRH